MSRTRLFSIVVLCAVLFVAPAPAPGLAQTLALTGGTVIDGIREISPRYEQDRSLSSDIRRVAAKVDHGDYCEYAASVLPSLAT